MRGAKWTSRRVLGALAAAGLAVATVAATGHHDAREDGATHAHSHDGPSDVATPPGSGAGPAMMAVGGANSARKAVPARGPRASQSERAALGGAGRAPMKKVRLADPRERERLVNVAHRELETLELQEPKYFLAVFDMMKEEERWDEKTLDAARGESHRYILARMNVLSGMLRRFIEDPESDHTLETDLLAQIDDEFKTKIDALSRDVPALADVQPLLTSTILKAPAFTDSSPESE